MTDPSQHCDELSECAAVGVASVAEIIFNDVPDLTLPDPISISDKSVSVLMKQPLLCSNPI